MNLIKRTAYIQREKTIYTPCPFDSTMCSHSLSNASTILTFFEQLYYLALNNPLVSKYCASFVLHILFKTFPNTEIWQNRVVVTWITSFFPWFFETNNNRSFPCPHETRCPQFKLNLQGQQPLRVKLENFSNELKTNPIVAGWLVGQVPC